MTVESAARVARVRCVCGAVRDVRSGEVFPAHPDVRRAARGRFAWCEHGDRSGVVVGDQEVRLA